MRVPLLRCQAAHRPYPDPPQSEKTTLLPQPGSPTGSAISMADIKTQYTYELLPDRFINVFGIALKQQHNSRKIQQFYKMGKITAYIYYRLL